MKCDKEALKVGRSGKEKGVSYRLVLLGLLAEQPRYGYDLKQTIEARSFAEYVPLSGGGLYYNLRKLQEDGYIAEQAVEREGTYPDRHIYEITEQGRAYFLQLLRTTLDDTKGRRHYDPIDAAMAFSLALPQAEVVARLHQQIDRLRPMLTQLELLREVQLALRGYIDVYSRLIVERNIHSLHNKITWLEIAIARIAADPLVTARLGAPYEAQFQQAGAAGYRVMQEARQVYQERVAAAWRDYEACFTTGTVDHEQSAAAHRRYQQQVADAWHEYEAIARAEQAAVLRAFAETEAAYLAALQRA